MGFWDNIRGLFSSTDPAQRVLPEPYEPWFSTYGVPVMDPGTPVEMYNTKHAQVDALYRTQPNVRKVVDFIARSIASIPLHVFERVDDNDRRRITGDTLSDLMSQPREGVGAFRFWHSVVSDWMLYDRWVVFKDFGVDGDRLYQIPSWRARLECDAFRRVTGVKYLTGERGDDGQPRWIDVPLEYVMFDYGYSPNGAGLSPIDTLRDLLLESSESLAFRRKVWENGPRVGGYIYTPEAVRPLSEQGLTRMQASLKRFTKGGSEEGGWPYMDEGRELRSIPTVTSADTRDLDGRELTAREVASAFHIPPELVGVGTAPYASMKELRKTLYRDSLGPYIVALEQAINAQLVPDFAAGRSLYVEANLESKLRGSFEEQAQMAQATVGAPTMTPNEYRARMNLPAIDGGDALYVPLNMLKGGQMPGNAGQQNVVADPVQEVQQPKALPLPRVKGVKATESGRHAEKAQQVLAEFFASQAQVVKSRLGAGDERWWDADRWDRELADALLALSLSASTDAAKSGLRSAGLDPDRYDVERTIAFLTEVSERNAEAMNATTKVQLDDALESDDEDAVDSVWNVATAQRAGAAAGTLSSFAEGFGLVESARQSSATATKTWVVTSGNPRPSHAAMDGETVAIDDAFSNGMKWPGDSGDADEVAGCSCEISVNYGGR